VSSVATETSDRKLFYGYEWVNIGCLPESRVVVGESLEKAKRQARDTVSDDELEYFRVNTPLHSITAQWLRNVMPYSILYLIGEGESTLSLAFFCTEEPPGNDE
jgi:hypothetical protein